jgi:hypothetical protein
VYQRSDKVSIGLGEYHDPDGGFWVKFVIPPAILFFKLLRNASVSVAVEGQADFAGEFL